jgi:uncharacterized membrane protein
MRGHPDLAAAAAAAAVCAVVALAVPLEPVRAAAALPLAFLLPGYALSAAAFGPRPPGPMPVLALSLGLSLATLVLGALALNYVPGGLRAGSWAALLVLVVLVGCTVAASRRSGPSGGHFHWPSIRLGVQSACLLLGAAFAVAASAVLWTKSLPAENARGFTRFWMLPASGPKAEGVRVGVVSQEQDPVAYRLEVYLAGRSKPITKRFTLLPAQKRRLQIPVAGRPVPADPVPVRALLFRSAQPETLYRRLTGWTRGSRAVP